MEDIPHEGSVASYSFCVMYGQSDLVMYSVSIPYFLSIHNPAYMEHILIDKLTESQYLLSQGH